MLAFDFNGTQLRLVDRSEIAEQIKSRILKEDWRGLTEGKSLISSSGLQDMPFFPILGFEAKRMTLYTQTGRSGN